MKNNKLKLIAGVLIALLVIPLFAFCQNSKQQQQSSSHFTITESFDPDVDISLTATPSETELSEGPKTAVYTYEAELIKGESSSLQEIPSSYLVSARKPLFFYFRAKNIILFHSFPIKLNLFF